MNHERNWRLIKLIPGPPGLPIVGNVFQFHISPGTKFLIYVYLLTNDVLFIQVKFINHVL